jgi:5'-nucleotidase
MNYLKFAVLLLSLGVSLSSSAKLMQIIHTNDLHSFFEGSRSGKGGYSRIKTLVDQLKSDAASKGIKTFFLDAGDFGEGSSYYFSNNGVDSLRALDLLGINATVIGNHDFILGGKELSRQIENAKMKAKILSANMEGKFLMGLTKKVVDSVDFDLDGMKIRVFGLTTPEIHFQYSLLPRGFIAPSVKKGLKLEKKVKKDKVDMLIGLTHIGLDEDMSLVSQSTNIDLIVGGHSHTRLDQPKMTQNKNGEIIPILQTGAHGLAVGSLIVDVLGKGEYKLIDYRLYDITKEIPENTSVKQFVDEAYVNREKYFNRSWNEVIGFSEIKLSGLHEGLVKDPQSCWSHHIARLTRETANTDLGLQLDIFQGEEIAAGEIRFGDLIDNFPHFRKWGDQGWNISRAKISGLLLNQILKFLGSGNHPLDATIDGASVVDEASGLKVKFINKKHKIENMLVNGQKIDNFKFYTIAMPSEIPYAIGKMSPLIRDLLLRHSREVEHSHFWPLFENYIAKNSPLKCLED